MPGGKRKSGILKAIAIIVIGVLAVMIAIPFLLDVNQFKPQLESLLSGSLGRQVKLGNLRLAMLSGSLAVEHISIADNPEFSRSPFVSAKSLKVAVELKPLIFSRTVRVSGVTLDQPSITLIRSAAGKWNFSDLGTGDAAEQAAPQQGESGSLSGSDVSIKELKIVEGQVTMIRSERGRKSSVYNNLSFQARDLSHTASFPFSLAASIPGGGTLKLEGKAGPLNDKDMMATPLDAEMDVKQVDLGSTGFIEDSSGLAGIIDFNGSVNSDGNRLQSKGKASAARLRMIKGGSPSGKPVSLQYALDYDLASRNGALSDATAGSGKAMAHLSGTYELRGSDLILNMALRGTNMPVEDLTALLPAFGIQLPRGASLQGGFLNTDMAAVGPVEKLVITGTVELSNTRLAGFDLSGQMAAVGILAGLQSGRETAIEKLSAGVRMAQDGIQVSNLLLIMPELGRLNGNGRIASDQSLDFTMRAMLKPGGAAGSGLEKLAKGGVLDVPFFVRGTSADPKFIPDMSNTAGSLLESVLGKGSTGDQTNKKDIGNILRDLFQKKK